MVKAAVVEGCRDPPATRWAVIAGEGPDEGSPPRENGRNVIDTQQFDTFVQVLGRGMSRRGALALLAGAMGLGFEEVAGKEGRKRQARRRSRQRVHTATKVDKVAICHYDADTGTYDRRNVTPNAFDAHIAHGDNSAIGCATGDALNLDTCECEPVLVNECAGIGGIGCPFGATCAENQDNGLFICVNVNTGGEEDNDCTTSADCDEPGEVCVLDGNSPGGLETHCHLRFAA